MIRSNPRSVLVALIAVFALAGVASASASAALPEFRTGPGEQLPTSYSGTSASATWKLPNATFKCTTSTISGTITTAKTTTGTILVFNGCKVEGKTCRSEGSENNEQIRTELLDGTLVYLSKTAKTVGIDYKAHTGSAIIKKLHCFGGFGEVRGSIAMPIISVNKLATAFTLTVHAKSEEYETESGEHKVATLETDFPSGVFAPMFWEFTSSLTTSKKVEIKA